MKRIFAIILCLVLVFALAGCGDGAKRGASRSPGVSDILAQGSAVQSEGTIKPAAEESGKEAASPAPGALTDPGRIDLDLTKLSSTMVYSEVYNMMASPERYIGSTIKMDGEFALYHDEATDEYYFACVIQDATACCAQGIEFVLTEDYRYPDDYPKPGDEICVVGVFDTYKEGSYTYCTLRNARLFERNPPPDQTADFLQFPRTILTSAL